jgi:CheY-like chemotaxis protein/anti-sigma regulatory factor (Ser/Thr protein kinase)
MNERDNENSVQRQAREIIERQVGNLTKLVSDLLDVSRVVSGRIRLNLQTLDLRQVLDHALQTSESLIAQRKHLLVVNGEGGPLWTNADATRIEEVLINLLSNAAKYTDEGGCIEVHCGQLQGQNCVEVRIRDNGMGIEPDLLPRIFDLFTQSDRTLERSQGGLGIGLNLASRLVQLHGGTIEAHSPPPGETKGSEFVIRLPAAPAPNEMQPADEPEGAPRASGGRRVLVVDDNVDQVTMLVSGLRNKGYAVQSAFTGPEGLKAALQWNPDVMLLDIGLPGLSGYEVARQVRSALASSSGKMKLIALTGYGRETDVALAQEAGFDIHLTKPCDFEQLDRLLAE